MTTWARWLFAVSAAANFAVGAGLLFGRTWLAPALRLDPIAGTNLVLVNFTGAMICVFGYGYVRLALDPVRFRPLIHYSAVGKLLAFAAAAVPWALGAIGPTIPAIMGGDVVLALLFIDYLRRTRPD